MQKFYEKFEGAEFSFNKFIPLPSELSGKLSPARIVSLEEYENQADDLAITEEMSTMYKNNFGFDNWYDWQVNNWGTKWDAHVCSETKNEDSFHVWFDTAWSPPTLWLEKVHNMFPDLSFELKYEEEGMGFWGSVEVNARDGRWIEEGGDIEYNEDGEIINSVF